MSANFLKTKKNQKKPPLWRRIAGRVFLFLAGIALACAALEGYLRLKWPFLNGEFLPIRIHPKAGVIYEPNSEMRWTNPHNEFFIVERVNSLGFLDREPLSPEQRGTGCHIAFIGDSFVESRQVVIADKFHVQLERLAAKALPHLNMTTSAFGIRNTGQINQLPYYDEFARHLKPCVLVLVFVGNDFANNHPVLYALQRAEAWDVKHPPFVTAEKNADGAFELREPDPDFSKHMLPRPPMSWKSKVRIYLIQKFYLVRWLGSKRMLWKYAREEATQEGRKDDSTEDAQITAWLKGLEHHPNYASHHKKRPPNSRVNSIFKWENLPPMAEEALEFTAFGLDQFKERADRDGIPLLIFSTYTMGTQGDRRFDRMHAMAKERGIPVIDQTDYILRQGSQITDAHWKHDRHWNTIGHQWAAEALLEYLKENPHICRAQSNSHNSADATQQHQPPIP